MVCVSEAIAATAVQAGIPRNKILSVYNGISAKPVLPLSTNDSSLRLGIVGSIGAWKGHDDLLEAIGILTSNGCRVTLRVFGNDQSEYAHQLKSKARDLGISDWIEWRGFVEAQESVFGSIDVCIVPSRCYEAFGMSALESSAFGRPVICTRRGGLTEVVQDGVTGLVVEPERPDQLAQAIHSFIANRDLVAKMGEAARQRSNAIFSQKRFVRQFVELIERARGPSSGGIVT